MKKKIVSIILSMYLCCSVTACGNSNSRSSPVENDVENEASIGSEDKPADKEENPTDAKSSVERDLPESDYSDMGSGSFSVQTPDGDSADGSIPVLFVSADDVLIQIGYAAEAMDGSHLSYIYIDGMEVVQEQLGEMAQGVIDLQENSSKEGIHTVEVVQYSTGEPGGEITTYKSCQYEIKIQ